MALNIVILAAGQGKRMHTRLPKVLHRVGGQTLIARVIETARRLQPRTICVVYGYGGKQVPEAVAAPDVVFVKQAPQLGTGHALQQALPKLSRSTNTLVLYGDVPLIRAETLAPMVAGTGERVRVLTTVVEAPFGYGRIVRDRAGRIKRIVEESDATPRERRIREVNTGMMTLPTRRLAKWLGWHADHG